MFLLVVARLLLVVAGLAGVELVRKELQRLRRGSHGRRRLSVSRIWIIKVSRPSAGRIRNKLDRGLSLQQVFDDLILILDVYFMYIHVVYLL